MAIALAAVGSDGGLEKRDGHDPLFASGFLLGAASGCDKDLIVGRLRKLLTLARAEDGHYVAAVQAGLAPVKPTVGFAGEFA